MPAIRGRRGATGRQKRLKIRRRAVEPSAPRRRSRAAEQREHAVDRRRRQLRDERRHHRRRVEADVEGREDADVQRGKGDESGGAQRELRHEQQPRPPRFERERAVGEQLAERWRAAQPTDGGVALGVRRDVQRHHGGPLAGGPLAIPLERCRGDVDADEVRGQSERKDRERQRGRLGTQEEEQRAQRLVAGRHRGGALREPGEEPAADERGEERGLYPTTSASAQPWSSVSSGSSACGDISHGFGSCDACHM